MTAHARLLSGEESEAAGRLIDRKYPVLQRLLVRLTHNHADTDAALRLPRSANYPFGMDLT